MIHELNKEKAPLPYGMVITRILRHFEFDLSLEEGKAVSEGHIMNAAWSLSLSYQGSKPTKPKSQKPASQKRKREENSSSEEAQVPAPAKSKGVKICEPASTVPRRSRYSEPKAKVPQSSGKSKGKASKESKKAKKSASVRQSERVKASFSVAPASGKSKQTQNPISVDSEETDSEETIDFTPLQVQFPEPAEQPESKSSTEEVDFSTDEDTEAEWEHIFSGHTFAETVSIAIPEEEPVDMAIVPSELNESEKVKEQAPSVPSYYIDLSIFNQLPLLRPTSDPSTPSFSPKWTSSTYHFFYPNIPPSLSPLINPHHLSPLSLTALLPKPVSDPVTISAAPELITSALTTSATTPEIPHHIEVVESLRRTEDRLGSLEREFDFLKAELAVLKEEHRSLKEYVIGLPTQIGTQIHEALRRLWTP